jgi:hypothetical protein
MSKNPILQIALKNLSTLKVIIFVEKAALVTKMNKRKTHSVNAGFLPVLYDAHDQIRVKQRTGTAFFLIDFLMAFTCIDEMRIMGQNV